MIQKADILRILVWHIIIIQTKTLGQVCVETKMAYRDVPETFLYTYMEAYEKTNCLFWCTATRVATAMGTRTVRKLIPEQINVCCDGYIKDENSDGNSIHCKPDCTPSCVNGYCKSPGECACNPGYLPDVFDTHICSPLCSMGCDHGTCTAPNTCLCDSEYNFENGVCEPICSEPCLNGSCVAPETCQCLPGYKKTENDTCEPFCSSYTASGKCINTITCEPGWTKVIQGPVEICEPVCSEPCTNGTCIAPDTCECLNGYEKSANDICEPHCSFECVHGSCISPQTCVCDPGWYKMESNGTCRAHCDYNCGNGTCVAPNVCECYPGYEFDKSEVKDAAPCVPICNDCEGSCVAPDICICEPHQEMMLVNADGGPCDCVDNCTDGANKCEKTKCLTTTTLASVTNYDIDEAPEGTTVSPFIISTTDVVFDDDSTVKSVHSEHNELKIEKASSWYKSNWCYAMGSIFIFIIIILMAATILRRKYFKSLNRNIFSAYKRVVTMTKLDFFEEWLKHDKTERISRIFDNICVQHNLADAPEDSLRKLKMKISSLSSKLNEKWTSSKCTKDTFLIKNKHWLEGSGIEMFDREVQMS